MVWSAAWRTGHYQLIFVSLFMSSYTANFSSYGHALEASVRLQTESKLVMKRVAQFRRRQSIHNSSAILMHTSCIPSWFIWESLGVQVKCNLRPWECDAILRRMKQSVVEYWA